MGMQLFPNTNQNSGLWAGLSGAEIDMRRELEIILDGEGFEPQRGHYIVYRRYDLSSPSEYYDRPTGQGKGGPAYDYDDEIYLARKWTSQTASSENQTPIGLLAVPYSVYYVEHIVAPKSSDEILEFEWDDHTIVPTATTLPEDSEGNHVFTERYNIKAVNNLRDLQGRTEFWALVCVSDKVKW